MNQTSPPAASPVSEPSPAPELGAHELSAILTYLPDFVVTLDSERRFTWVNRLDPTLDLSSVIGKPVEQFLTARDGAIARRAIARCFATGEPSSYEATGYREGGWETPYACRVIPFRSDRHGRPRVLLISTDITRRKRTQRELEASEGCFRQLVECAPCWVMTVDTARRITYLNRPPPLPFTETVECLVGRALSTLVSEEWRAPLADRVDRALRGETSDWFEVEAASSGRFYRLRAAALPDAPSGGQALIVAIDITREREEERQRLLMVRELNHRTKNLLAVVSGMAEQTLQASDSPEAFRASFQGRLRALASVHDSLATARWTQLDLRSLVEAVVVPVVGTCARLQDSEHGPALSSRSATALGLALYELATNAIRHGAASESGGRLSLCCKRQEEGGIALHWREHGLSSRAVEEEGLGLRLVRGFVEHELGGRLTLSVGADRREVEIWFSGEEEMQS